MTKSGVGVGRGGSGRVSQSKSRCVLTPDGRHFVRFWTLRMQSGFLSRLGENSFHAKRPTRLEC